MSRKMGVLVALLTFVVACVMSTSSAFALPDISVTLLNNEGVACYEVSEFQVNVKAGWWKDENCTTRTTNKLEGRYETALPIKKALGVLWCAEFLTIINNEKSGHFKTNECSLKANNTESDGPFDEVNIYPLHLNYESTTVASTLETTAGGLLTGKGLKVLFLIGELSALGTFRADFLEVKDGSKKCMSTGDAIGTVLTEGSFHVVYTNLSPLLMGILYLPNEVVIECEGTNATVKGSILSSFIAEGNTLTELVSVSGQLLKGASAGKPKIEEYYNDAGTKVKAKLETTTGGSTKESNEIVEGTPVFSALGGKMFVVTSR